MDLPLDADLRIGFITAMPSAQAAQQTAALAQQSGYESVWVGDHIAFAVPILDPLLQLAQVAACSDGLLLGTSVFLLPLRHPTLVAKQVATLDLLCGGRLVFGVGVGGEFPLEYAACGVPLEERGARLSEAIPLLKRLWSGELVQHAGRFWSLPSVRMLPAPAQPGGPPVWCGGRSEAALRRIGRMADGWVSYVVTPAQYVEGLELIAKTATACGRDLARFGSGHLLFTCIDETYEAALDAASQHLSQRYAMDFRGPARKYAALGRPEDVAETIDSFRRSGLRHLIVDPVCRAEGRDEQLERFAREVRPLLS